MRLFSIGVLAALALAAAGCGAKDESAATGGAEIVSASAPAFVSIDADLSSDQWQQVDELLRKFPARSMLISELRSSLKEDSGLDYEDDIKPALGDEVDLVWLDFAYGGTNVVGLTKPKDEDAFQRMVEKGNSTGPDDLICEKTDDWFVCADSQEKIDRFKAMPGDEKLADDELFNDALAELPDEALVHVYVRGQSIVDTLKDLDLPGSPLPLGAEQQPEFLSAALAAEGSGLRLVGSGRAAKAPESKPEPFESTFLDVVPDDAVAFLTFKGGDEYQQQLDELEKNDAYRMGVREFERMLGMPLSSLLKVFKDEVALYVRPGSPIPEVTLLLEAPNEQDTLRRVDTAITALTKSLPAQPCHAPTQEAGVDVECVGLEEVELRWAAFDQMVMVTIGQGAIAELRSDGDKLADDEGFEDARDAAGMPTESVGFMWLDLEDGIPMVLGLAAATGGSIPAEIRENLEPLGSFLAWAESDGRSGSFTAFLQID
jgi:Protein of unknown function (DUF3352)